jgi:FMN phosphatase YigB (HAD superfamily)
MASTLIKCEPRAAYPPRSSLSHHPGAHELLRTLAKNDIRIVVVSNAVWRTATEYWSDFRAFDMGDDIHVVVSSVDIKWRKPTRQFFLTTLAHTASTPEECISVGHSEVNDIIPAKELGMHAIRVVVEEDLPPPSTANAVCRSLWEVAALAKTRFAVLSS